MTTSWIVDKYWLFCLWWPLMANEKIFQHNSMRSCCTRTESLNPSMTSTSCFWILIRSSAQSARSKLLFPHIRCSRKRLENLTKCFYWIWQQTVRCVRPACIANADAHHPEMNGDYHRTSLFLQVKQFHILQILREITSEKFLHMTLLYTTLKKVWMITWTGSEKNNTNSSSADLSAHI